MRIFLITFAAFALGAWTGLHLPDVDQRIDILLHRSAITHGPIVPGFLFLILRRARKLPARSLAMSVCLGFSVHMAFDLFPSAWSGYALVSIPIHGWMPALASMAWIAATGIICTYWATRLVKSPGEYMMLCGAVAVIFALAAQGERTFIGPLIALSAAIVSAGTLSLLKGPGDQNNSPLPS